MLRAVAFSLLVILALGDLTWETDSGIDFKTVEQKKLRKSFKAWKKKFNKHYKNERDEMKHYRTFIQNWMKIVAWNSQDNVSYKLGHNQFSDMTPKEFRYYIHGHEGSCLRQDKMKLPRKLLSDDSDSDSDSDVSEDSGSNGGDVSVNVPDSVDWSTKGVVTPVKNQKQCGSCWAFSTTGSIECRSAIATGKLVSLSEQQLVDCSKAEGNQGCQGGLMDDAFKYVEKNGGLCTEEAYPYHARNGVCKAATCGEKYDPISSYTDVAKRSSAGLQEAAAAGCVSVAIEADQSAFQLYKSGILDGRCGKKLDHGVLVVGYGADSTGRKFWKVKNSWGASWGEQGYVRMCRECGKDFGNGECGILDSASYPVV